MQLFWCGCPNTIYETQIILKNNVIIEDFGRMSSFFHVYETGLCDAGYELPLLSVTIPDVDPIIFVENCANLDYYDSEVCPTTSILIDRVDVNIFPNPANSEVVIENLIDDAIIEFKDINGVIVLSKEYIANSNSRLSINISSLQNSIYFIIINDNRANTLGTYKILKVNSF